MYGNIINGISSAYCGSKTKPKKMLFSSICKIKEIK